MAMGYVGAKNKANILLFCLAAIPTTTSNHPQKHCYY